MSPESGGCSARSGAADMTEGLGLIGFGLPPR